MASYSSCRWELVMPPIMTQADGPLVPLVAAVRGSRMYSILLWRAVKVTAIMLVEIEQSRYRLVSAGPVGPGTGLVGERLANMLKRELMLQSVI